MIKIPDIYVSITVPLLQIIYTNRDRENIQHYMLDNTNYNNISTNNYKQEIFPTFMLALNVHVTNSLTLVYMEVTDK